MKNNLLLAVLAVLLIDLSALAAPMDGRLVKFTQPDGTKIRLEVHGDEYYAETRTPEGYTVVFDPASKTYFYAALPPDGSELLSTGIPVAPGLHPKGVAKNLTISKESRKEKVRKARAADPAEAARARRWEDIKKKSRDQREKKLKNKDAAESSVSGDAVFYAPADEAQGGSGTFFSPPVAQAVGKRVGLTILVEFSDEPATISQKEIDDYCNKPGYTGFGNDGSAYDYFLTQSEGKLRYYNLVTAYVTVPRPKSYYNDLNDGKGRELLADALKILVDQGFDFSACTTNSAGRLHAVNLFFAGPNSGVWSKGLWPHMGSLSPDVYLGGGRYADLYQISDIDDTLELGTFCHENGHLICDFPDLYDYDGDSSGTGRYCLMSSTGYGTHPNAINGYLTYHAGWTETISINSTSSLRGSVRVENGPLFQYTNPEAATEYFLIDNRQKTGWEAGSRLADEGLLILHCDEGGDHSSQEMTETNHYEVSVEQADGRFELEYDINSGGAGDLFHSGYSNQFTDATLPNAHWWSNATTNPASGDASGLNIHDISLNGETMTFIVGAGSPTGAPAVGLDRTLLQLRTPYGSSPASNKVAIWNKTSGTLNYTVGSTNSWISVSPASGSATTESDVITLSYSTASLAPGVYYGRVAVTNSANPADVQAVNIELTVEALPLLAVSPAAISITGAVDCVSSTEFLMLGNAGGGSFSYTVTGPSWLQLSATNGTVFGETDAVGVSFNGAGLSEGDYTGTLVITAPGVANSPISVPLSFAVRNLLLDAPLSGILTNLQPVAIRWSSSPSVYAQLDIELWRNGKQKVVIADNTPNDGLYEWTVPAGLPSATNYILRIAGEGSPAYKASGPLEVWVHKTSFENGLDGWTDRTDDDFDWTVRSGTTPTTNTGPSGASDGTYYLYTESSLPNNPSKLAALWNRFDFSARTGVELKFDYHMYGNQMGHLHLDVFDGTSWHLDAWSVTGQQHTASTSSWKTAVINLSAYAGYPAVDLRFRGITGSGSRSDMAIDNVRLADAAERLLTNNVPASWMTGFGLAATDPAALLDSDGDGLPNWAEYLAGTSPVDFNSVLRLEAAELLPGGLSIEWSAVYGKTYAILGSTNLLSGSWSNQVSGIPGVEPSCTYTIPTSQNLEFFRIKIE